MAEAKLQAEKALQLQAQAYAASQQKAHQLVVEKNRRIAELEQVVQQRSADEAVLLATTTAKLLSELQCFSPDRFHENEKTSLDSLRGL